LIGLSNMLSAPLGANLDHRERAQKALRLPIIPKSAMTERRMAEQLRHQIPEHTSEEDLDRLAIEWTKDELWIRIQNMAGDDRGVRICVDLNGHQPCLTQYSHSAVSPPLFLAKVILAIRGVASPQGAHVSVDDRRRERRF
jgi:hypothetical protein